MSQSADNLGSALSAAENPIEICFCQSDKSYQDCCGLYHEGAVAPNAAALMRSRYSAYVLGKAAYIHRSWSAQTRPTKQALKKAEPLHWLGLEIVRTEAGEALDDAGLVEFIATYRDGEQVARLHEVSRFIRENGRWVYVAGEQR